MELCRTAETPALVNAAAVAIGTAQTTKTGNASVGLVRFAHLMKQF